MILGSGSDYYKHPEKYKIRFRGDREEIYRRNPYFIHTDLWYSEEPYIDQSVRMNRLDRICKELYKHGVYIGDFAERVLANLKEEKIIDV